MEKYFPEKSEVLKVGRMPSDQEIEDWLSNDDNELDMEGWVLGPCKAVFTNDYAHPENSKFCGYTKEEFVELIKSHRNHGT